VSPGEEVSKEGEKMEDCICTRGLPELNKSGANQTDLNAKKLEIFSADFKKSCGDFQGFGFSKSIS
jgi:hypothetical protein